MSRLKELRVAAEKATPGPWIYDAATLLVGCEETVDQAEATSVPDAKFIAAANPETVLALVALVKELRAALGGTVWLLHSTAIVGEPLRLARAALASAATWMEE